MASLDEKVALVHEKCKENGFSTVFADNYCSFLTTISRFSEEKTQHNPQDFPFMALFNSIDDYLHWYKQTIHEEIETALIAKNQNLDLKPEQKKDIKKWHDFIGKPSDAGKNEAEGIMIFPVSERILAADTRTTREGGGIYEVKFILPHGEELLVVPKVFQIRCRKDYELEKGNSIIWRIKSEHITSPISYENGKWLILTNPRYWKDLSQILKQEENNHFEDKPLSGALVKGRKRLIIEAIKETYSVIFQYDKLIKNGPIDLSGREFPKEVIEMLMNYRSQIKSSMEQRAEYLIDNFKRRFVIPTAIGRFQDDKPLEDVMTEITAGTDKRRLTDLVNEVKERYFNRLAHSIHSLAHRDLKADNVFVDRYNNVLIHDVGQARVCPVLTDAVTLIETSTINESERKELYDGAYDVLKSLAVEYKAEFFKDKKDYLEALQLTRIEYLFRFIGLCQHNACLAEEAGKDAAKYSLLKNYHFTRLGRLMEQDGPE